MRGSHCSSVPRDRALAVDTEGAASSTPLLTFWLGLSRMTKMGKRDMGLCCSVSLRQQRKEDSIVEPLIFLCDEEIDMKMRTVL
jgi:hypothetical protein